jgi:hypothetical protein
MPKVGNVYQKKGKFINQVGKVDRISLFFDLTIGANC